MRRLFALISSLILFAACDTVSSVIHNDEVVASLGKEKLYLSEVRGCVPAFATPEHSAMLVQQYIDKWALSVLYMQQADAALSKEELDVERELEEYRRSLIRYRFEQAYVREHLDTAVSSEQVQAYYEAHEENFVLERPLLKLRFAVVMSDSPSKDMIKAALKEEECNAIMQSDSVLRSAAIRYADYSKNWTDAATVAREYGLDYLTMLGLKSGDYIVYEPAGLGVVMIGYVADMVRYGIAPVEYCRPRICEMILGSRKREMLSSLEQELLEEARSNNKLVINE